LVSLIILDYTTRFTSVVVVVVVEYFYAFLCQKVDPASLEDKKGTSRTVDVSIRLDHQKNSCKINI